MINGCSFNVFYGNQSVRVWCINTLSGGKLCAKLCYDIEYTGSDKRTIAPQAKKVRPTLHITVIFVIKTLSKALKHTV